LASRRRREALGAHKATLGDVPFGRSRTSKVEATLAQGAPHRHTYDRLRDRTVIGRRIAEETARRWFLPSIIPGPSPAKAPRLWN